MSSFDGMSSVSYQTEDFQYLPTLSKSQAMPRGKRIRLIPSGNTIEVLDKREDISQLDMTSELQKEFQRLCLAWKKETESISSLTEVAMHHAYQRIIGLGPAAMPLIIAELAREPDWWFWALRAITGVDPVRDEDRGRLAAMKNAWLRWWESEGAAGRWKV